MTRETQKLSLKETMPAREYELLQMLTYKRKAWSAVENAFISTYILPLDVEEDDGGMTVLDTPVGGAITLDDATRFIWAEAEMLDRLAGP